MQEEPKIRASIMDIVNLARDIKTEIYKKHNLKQQTGALTALTSGLDVGVTLLETSVGLFDGLTRSEAISIINYFMSESKRHLSDDPETSIWYFSFAKALNHLFIQDARG